MAGAGGMQEHPCSIAVLKSLERGLGIRIDGRNRRRGARLGAARGKAFHLADTHAAASDPARKIQALLRIRNGEQRPAVTRRETALLDQVLNHGLELQQSEGIGDRGAVLPCSLGDVLLREVELVREALEGSCLLHRVQVLALEVFDQRHLQRDFLGNFANDDRYARQCRPLGRSPAALAGDQLVAEANPSDDKWLDDSARADRARQFLERLFAKARAWLIGTGIDEVDIDLQ